MFLRFDDSAAVIPLAKAVKGVVLPAPTTVRFATSGESPDLVLQNETVAQDPIRPIGENRYEFRTFAAGATTLRIWGESGVATVEAELPTAPGRTVDLGEIRFEPWRDEETADEGPPGGATVVVQARSPAGEPIPFVAILGGRFAESEGDEVRISGLPPGPHDLLIGARDHGSQAHRVILTIGEERIIEAHLQPRPR